MCDRVSKILLMIVLCVAFNAHAQQAAEFKVNIQAPQGFEKSTSMPGYVMANKNASIIMIESSQPLFAIIKKFDNLQSKSLTVIEKGMVEIEGEQALLVKASQNIDGVNFLKWMLFIGKEGKSMLVDASFPAEFEEELSERMKEAVVSVKWNQTP